MNVCFIGSKRGKNGKENWLIENGTKIETQMIKFLQAKPSYLKLEKQTKN
jgi:hypothetical protein